MERDLGFVVGILWNWGRIREKKKDMITDHNSDLGFTAYDSIQRDQNQYPKQIASFFLSKSFNNFQRLLHGYI